MPKSQAAVSAAKRKAAKSSSAESVDNPREKRAYLPAQERRESIIKAAQEVFSRTTLQGARIRDLATAAGVNQATLYSHFDSKEELFVAAVVEPMIDAMQGMYARSATYENASSREALLETSKASVERHLRAVMDAFPLLTTALFSDPELGAKLYREHLAPLFAARSKVMAKAVNEQVDSRVFSVLAFGMFFGASMDAIFGEKNADIDHLSDQISRIAAFGFAKDHLRDQGKE